MSLGPTVRRVVTAWFVAGAFVALVARVQAQGVGAAAADPDSAQSTIQVPMVNYYALGGAAKTEFEATALMSNAKGLTQVAITKEGSVSIKGQFSGLDNPTPSSERPSNRSESAGGKICWGKLSKRRGPI